MIAKLVQFLIIATVATANVYYKRTGSPLLGAIWGVLAAALV